MDSSSITRTPRATTRVGRRLASEPTTRSEHRQTDDHCAPVADFVVFARSAQSLLKQDYKDEITLEEAKALALKIMSKTMDSTKLGSEKRESSSAQA